MLLFIALGAKLNERFRWHNQIFNKSSKSLIRSNLKQWSCIHVNLSSSMLYGKIPRKNSVLLRQNSAINISKSTVLDTSSSFWVVIHFRNYPCCKRESERGKLFRPLFTFRLFAEHVWETLSISIDLLLNRLEIRTTENPPLIYAVSEYTCQSV